MGANVYDRIVLHGQPTVLTPETIWRNRVYSTGYERFQFPAGYFASEMFESRAVAAASSINATSQALHVAGYAAPGDRGDGIYHKVDLEGAGPLEAWQFQSTDGAFWQFAASEEIRVQHVGATASVVTNDAGTIVAAGTDDIEAFDAAVEYCRLFGCNLHVPAGKYRLSRDWVVNCQDDPVNVMWPTKYRFLVRGDGERATFLFWDEEADPDVPVNGFQYVGKGSGVSNPSLGHASQPLIRDMTLVKKSGKRGLGLYLQDHSHGIAENVTLLQWRTGFQLRDIHLSMITNVKPEFCDFGGFVDKQNDTQPNCIIFRNCDFSVCANNALDMTNMSEILFDSCDFNSSGLGGLDDSIRWGVRIRYDATPIEGVVATTFFNCRFEGTDADTYADIYYQNAFFDGVVNVIGTDFLRDGGPSGPGSERWAKYNILMDGQGTGTHTLNLQGSAFIGFNGYVPDAARPNVWITDLTKDVRISEIGCHFAHDIEFPVEAFSTGARSRLLSNSARALLADTTGALNREVNVSSVAKTGTGLYVVTFRHAQVDDFYGVNFTAYGGLIRFFSITAQTAAGFTVQCWDQAGAATDTRFGFVVTGGSRI